MTGYWLIAALSLVVAICSFESRAEDIHLSLEKQVKCVSSSVMKVHDSIIDYSSYKNLDNGERFITKVPLVQGGPGVVPMRFVDMWKSKMPGNQFIMKTSTETSAMVEIAVQPYGCKMDIQDFNPHFTLICRSELKDQNGFTHSCQLIHDEEYYGLSDFNSELTVSQGTSPCRPGESRLEYSFSMDVVREDVDAIKFHVLETGALGSLLVSVLGLDLREYVETVVDSAFDERTFFLDYYSKFYESWSRSLK